MISRIAPIVMRQRVAALSGLLQLPADDWELWMRAVLDGNAQIH